MPATGADTEQHASPLVAVALAFQARLLTRLLIDLSKGWGSDTAGFRLASEQAVRSMAFRAQVDGLVARLYANLGTAARTAVARCLDLAAERAMADLGTPVTPVDPADVDRLTVEFMARLQQGTQPVLLASVQDTVNEVMRAAMAPVLSGRVSRRQAAQDVMLNLAQRGIGGFVDAKGSTWQLDTYIEAATRRFLAQTTTQATLGHYARAGRDLVTVSVVGHPCDLCWPWEGETLSISGNNPEYESVQAALDQGLLHGGCKHYLLPYDDSMAAGIQAALENRPTREEAQATYKSSQELNRRQRNARAWARRLHYAETAAQQYPTDSGLAAEVTRSRYWLNRAQASIRDYARENGLVRDRSRETAFSAR